MQYPFFHRTMNSLIEDRQNGGGYPQAPDVPTVREVAAGWRGLLLPGGRPDKAWMGRRSPRLGWLNTEACGMAGLERGPRRRIGWSLEDAPGEDRKPNKQEMSALQVELGTTVRDNRCPCVI